MKMKMNDRLACGSKFSCGMYFPLVLNMILWSYGDGSDKMRSGVLLSLALVMEMVNNISNDAFPSIGNLRGSTSFSPPFTT